MKWLSSQIKTTSNNIYKRHCNTILMTVMHLSENPSIQNTHNVQHWTDLYIADWLSRQNCVEKRRWRNSWHEVKYQCYWHNNKHPHMLDITRHPKSDTNDMQLQHLRAYIRDCCLPSRGDGKQDIQQCQRLKDELAMICAVAMKEDKS